VAQRNKIKELDGLMQRQEQDNARRIMAENAQKEIEREREYKDRFLRFDENQKAKHQWYQANISDPTRQKSRAEIEKEKLQQQAQNNWDTEKDRLAKNLHSRAVDANKETLLRQINEKQQAKHAERGIYGADRNDQQKIAQDINLRNFEEKEERRLRQEAYRDILAS